MKSNKPKSVNEILKENFKKDFDFARKQYEAEQKQNPFYLVVYKDNDGEVIHKELMCNN